MLLIVLYVFYSYGANVYKKAKISHIFRQKLSYYRLYFVFAPMEDKDFEILWLQNRERLLAEDTEWQAMKESYKVHGVTDVLFYAIPIIVGIMCLDYLPIANELLRWVVCAGIIIVVMAICMLIRTAGKGVKSASDIEKRVKEEYRRASSKSPREVKVRGEK